jgi:hypothetical protein
MATAELRYVVVRHVMDLACGVGAPPLRRLSIRTRRRVDGLLARRGIDVSRDRT